MSEKYARSCSGKRRYNSLRQAQVAAKASHIVYGIEMNAYGPCEFCRKFHVGSTHPWEGRTAREETENSASIDPLF